MCRSKCFKARTFVLGKGPSLILETEDSWEVLKENYSPPLHWGARINSGNRQVVIMMEYYLLSYPWSFSVLKGSLTRVHLQAEAEKVWGLFRASSRHIVPISNLFCTSPPSPLSCSLIVEGDERNFPTMMGGGEEGVLTRDSYTQHYQFLRDRGWSAQFLQGKFAFPLHPLLIKPRLSTELLVILLFIPASGGPVYPQAAMEGWRR